jgi:hypothetical protein
MAPGVLPPGQGVRGVPDFQGTRRSGLLIGSYGIFLSPAEVNVAGDRRPDLLRADLLRGRLLYRIRHLRSSAASTIARSPRRVLSQTLITSEHWMSMIGYPRDLVGYADKAPHRMNEPRMASFLVARGRPGFYFRVLEEGEVEAGDEIVHAQQSQKRLAGVCNKVSHSRS